MFRSMLACFPLCSKEKTQSGSNEKGGMSRHDLCATLPLPSYLLSNSSDLLVSFLCLSFVFPVSYTCLLYEISRLMREEPSFHKGRKRMGKIDSSKCTSHLVGCGETPAGAKRANLSSASSRTSPGGSCLLNQGRSDQLEYALRHRWRYREFSSPELHTTLQ